MPKTALRTDEALWQQIVKEITAGDKGGKPGQWSARKAQLSVAAYKAAGGGYIGPKTSDNSLAKWTREKWRTKSGKPSLETGERYLPEAAIKALTDEEYKATTKAKRAGMRRGQQFVPQPLEIAAKVAPFRRAKRPKRQPNPAGRQHMAKFYAKPYLFDAPGFYFQSAEDFENKFPSAGFEEFSCQLVDGDETARELAEALPMTPNFVREWFDLLAEVEEDTDLLVKICAYNDMQRDLTSVGDFERNRAYIEDATVQHGSLEDLARYYVEEGITDLVRNGYVDEADFEYDLQREGYQQVEVVVSELGGSKADRKALRDLDGVTCLFLPTFDGDPYKAGDILDGIRKGTVYENTRLDDYAAEVMQELADTDPSRLEAYINYDAIIDDLRDDYSELNIGGNLYTCRFG